MKKILTLALVVCMIITMASFPASAADPEIRIVGASSNHPAQTTNWGNSDVSNVFDGQDNADAITNYFRANYKITPSGAKSTAPNSSNFNFTLEFEYPQNVTEFYSSWGVNHATGIVLWVSNDLNGEWIEIADLKPTTQKTTLPVNHDGYYKYVNVELYSAKGGDNNPACLEVKFFGVQDPNAKEDVKIQPAGVESALAPDTSLYGTIDAVIDGSEAGNINFFRSTNRTTSTGTPGNEKNFSFVVDLGGYYNITKFYSSWGSKYANGIALWGSNDGVDFGDEPFAVLTPNSNPSTFKIEHEGAYQYIKVDAYSILDNNDNPACKEVTFYGTASEAPPEAPERIPTNYTVNYVDTQGNPVADARTETSYVGKTVTETAKSITGYTVDKTSQTITLVDGTNAITFIYTARAVVDYVVKYIDAEGNVIAETKNGAGYVGDSVTETAVKVSGYNADKASLTITLNADKAQNTITFTYTAIDPNAPAEIVPIGVATNVTVLKPETPLKAIIDGVDYASAYNYFRSVDLPMGDGTTELASFVFEFAAPTNLAEIWFNMGGCHMKYGKLYGSNTTSDPSSSEGWTELHTFDNLTFSPVSSDTSAGNTNTQSITHTGYYRYFKVEVTGLSKAGGLVWLESKFVANGAVAPLGANIRIESDELSAGLRFAVNISKAILGIDGEDYAYSETADVKFGMFLLPEDMLGSYSTLTQYLKAGGSDAIDVPAKKIFSQTNDEIIYTAVLTDIPENAYARDIVAVPYVLEDGKYAYYDEMTRNYRSVALVARETTYSDDEIAKITDATLKAQMQAVADELDKIVATVVKTKTVIPTATAIYSMGRTYNYNELLYAGAVYEYKFTGSVAGAKITKAGGDAVRFEVSIDGGDFVSYTTSDTNTNEYVFATDLNAYKEHIVRIMRASDIWAPKLTVNSIVVAEDATVVDNYSPDYDLKIEFVGDSITTGVKTSFFAQSYAYLTATALNANFNVVSRSGLGLHQNANNGSGGQLKSVYASVASGDGNYKYDYDPDLVVLNIGTNDGANVNKLDTTGKAEYRTAFKEKYVEMLEIIHEKNPNATILCTGGLMGDFSSVKTQITEAVALFKAENPDAKVYCEFLSVANDISSDTSWHPGVAGHAKGAEELIPIIKRIMNIQ